MSEPSSNISVDIDYRLQVEVDGLYVAQLNALREEEGSDSVGSSDQVAPEWTEMSSLSSVNMRAVKEYRQTAGDDKFLNQIKLDCKNRIADVRMTNRAICSLSAFMAIPALIGYLAKLSCSRNVDFLHRNGVLTRVKNPGEGDFKKIAGQIDGISYLEFVNRYLLQKADENDRKKDNGIAEVLYGMVRCGLLHGQTLQFGRELKEKSFDTMSPSSSTTQKNRLGKVTCKVTHNRQYERSLSKLESEIDNANGNPVTLVFCADKLCDEIESGIEKMFGDASSDSFLKSSILETFEKEPPIAFVDFDKELQDIKA